MAPINELSSADREAIVAWIGERPATVLPVAALLSGTGRVWLHGSLTDPWAVLVESPLVPGEPQGFGAPEALLELLEVATGWNCVEVDQTTAYELMRPFETTWGLARIVTDVVHRLDRRVEVRRHPLVRALRPGDLTVLTLADDALFADEMSRVETAAAAGRVSAAVDDEVIVGQSGSLAVATTNADVGVHVAAAYRRRGIAAAASSMVCAALQDAGLIPVWAREPTTTYRLRSRATSASPRQPDSPTWFAATPDAAGNCGYGADRERAMRRSPASGTRSVPRLGGCR